jgi:hypothetical protein
MAKKCKKEKCNPEACDNASCKTSSNTTTVTTTAKLSMPALTAAAAGVGIGVKSAANDPGQTQISIEDPAIAIRDNSADFYKLYAQYLALRELAMPLNGLPQTAPLPESVKISKITIDFSVDGKPNTAEIPGATSIAEVSVAIGTGLRAIIDKMHQTLFVLGHVTSNMQVAVKQAVTARTASSISLTNKTDEKTV